MSGLLVNLVFQITGGALGGNIAAGATKSGTLGKVDQIIAGAIGGGVGGQILGALVPIFSNTASMPDLGVIIGQVVGGIVSGAILIAIVGALKSRMA
jgi:hypothetical protein